MPTTRPSASVVASMVAGGMAPASSAGFTSQPVALGDVAAEAEQRFKIHVTVQSGRQLGATMDALIHKQDGFKNDLKFVQDRRHAGHAKTADEEAAFQNAVSKTVAGMIRDRSVHDMVQAMVARLQDMLVRPGPPPEPGRPAPDLPAVDRGPQGGHLKEVNRNPELVSNEFSDRPFRWPYGKAAGATGRGPAVCLEG